MLFNIFCFFLMSFSALQAADMTEPATQQSAHLPYIPCYLREMLRFPVMCICYLTVELSRNQLLIR